VKETRRVLVTGASGGIGSAIAKRLGAAGFHLCLHYHRNASKAEATAKEIVTAGGHARTLSFDVTDREAARRALESDMHAHGTFWGAVCNAGITADNTFPAMPGQDWDKVIATNLGGFYNVLHPLVMPLVRLRDGGRIVTIASVSGLMGNRGQTNYSAAKAGLIGASKALAVELASRGVTVKVPDAATSGLLAARCALTTILYVPTGSARRNSVSWPKQRTDPSSLSILHCWTCIGAAAPLLQLAVS